MRRDRSDRSYVGQYLNRQDTPALRRVLAGTLTIHIEGYGDLASGCVIYLAEGPELFESRKQYISAGRWARGVWTHPELTVGRQYSYLYDRFGQVRVQHAIHERCRRIIAQRENVITQGTWPSSLLRTASVVGLTAGRV